MSRLKLIGGWPLTGTGCNQISDMDMPQARAAKERFILQDPERDEWREQRGYGTARIVYGQSSMVKLFELNTSRGINIFDTPIGHFTSVVGLRHRIKAFRRFMPSASVRSTCAT